MTRVRQAEAELRFAPARPRAASILATTEARQHAELGSPVAGARPCGTLIASTAGADPRLGGTMTAAQEAIRVLVVDDDVRVARALGSVLSVQGFVCRSVDSPEAAEEAVEREKFDVLVADYQLGDITGSALLRHLRARGHAMPCVLITGAVHQIPEDERSVAAAVLQKPFAATLLNQAILRAVAAPAAPAPEPEKRPASVSAETLARVIQSLALARNREVVVDIVRQKARALIGADGATFVLREHDVTYYVDEDAIGPLFKGRRFPIDACIGGTCMLERRPVIVRDIYADPRIPAEAYTPTFVKSLVMVPIRSDDPIGAIGAYWAAEHEATQHEVDVLRALADSAAVALHNVALIGELEHRVETRTAELAAANRELELFTAAAAHDLSGPLAALYANAETVLLGGSETLAPGDRACIEEIRDAAVEMSSILSNLLRLSRMSAAELRRHRVDISRMAEELTAELQASALGRDVEVTIEPGLTVDADPELVRIALQNLLGNAWKYTGKREHARIELGQLPTQHGRALFVRDNGTGFDPAKAGKLFLPFRRLHDRRDFPGTGIGLVTVARIAAKHGGHVWAESELDRGATFYLQLGRVDSPPDDDPSAAVVRPR